MNFSIRGMETVEQTVGNRFFQLIIGISDRIIALRVDADDKKIPSREKVKGEKKEKAAPKKPSTPKTVKPKESKPKTPKIKSSKPASSKSKKFEDESISASEIVRPVTIEGGRNIEDGSEIEEPLIGSALTSFEPELTTFEKKSDIRPEPEKEGEASRQDAPFIVPQDINRKENQTRVEKPVVRSLKYSPDSFSVSSRRKNNLRLLRFGGGVLVVLIILGFGLNFLVKNKPATTVPASVTSDAPADVISTSTSAPIAATATAFPQSTATNAPTETPLVTPTLGVSSTLIGNDGATLVYVPEGEFTMGSDLAPDEQPVHQVALDAYWIDQTEVTNAMYEKCVDAKQCRPPVSVTSNTRELYFYHPDFGNYPVIFVSWSDANSYCSWAGRRLPTEAEWEKAARGTEGNVYPWGDDEPSASLLNVDFPDTTEVGRYPDGASVYGALDMAGNVWEWVADWYGESYYKDSPASNPLGPDSPLDPNFGQLRVLRGGSSWYNLDGSVRSADREQNGVRFFSALIGFRCAQGASQ